MAMNNTMRSPQILALTGKDNIFKSDNTTRTIKTNINEQGLFYKQYNKYFNNNYNLELNRITIEYQKKDNEVVIPIVFNLIDKNKI